MVMPGRDREDVISLRDKTRSRGLNGGEQEDGGPSQGLEFMNRVLDLWEKKQQRWLVGRDQGGERTTWSAAGLLDSAISSPPFLIGRAIHVQAPSASKTANWYDRLRRLARAACAKNLNSQVPFNRCPVCYSLHFYLYSMYTSLSIYL